jgi:chromosome transmission fidelity protein 4
VADNKFHCIILKGGDQYPYFPRPLLSEFDFKIPLSSRQISEEEENQDNIDSVHEREKLEEQFVQRTLDAALMADLVEATSSTHTQRTELARKEVDVDKTLLQLLAVECREGEERGMKALKLVELMRDRTGRIMEAAMKVAERYGRATLGEKIREVGERRMAGEMDDGL